MEKRNERAATRAIDQMSLEQIESLRKEIMNGEGSF